MGFEVIEVIEEEEVVEVEVRLSLGKPRNCYRFAEEHNQVGEDSNKAMDHRRKYLVS